MRAITFSGCTWNYAMACAAVLLFAARPALAAEPGWLANPRIDMSGFLAVAQEAAAHRETRRISEDEFLRRSKVPGTVVLDARSEPLFRMLHVRGAVNLSFPDIALDSLARVLPDRNVPILIYCNNNFGASAPFPAKLASASLNLSTYIALYTYGYRNIHELGPIIDIRTSRLRFAGTALADGAIMSAWPPDPWFQSKANLPGR